MLVGLEAERKVVLMAVEKAARMVAVTAALKEVEKAKETEAGAKGSGSMVGKTAGGFCSRTPDRMQGG